MGTLFLFPHLDAGCCRPPSLTHSEDCHIPHLHPDNSNAQLLKIFTGVDSFGCSLKDDILSHIRSSIPNVKIVDLNVDKYYTIASLIGHHVSTSRSSSSITTHGLLFCSTGVGVSIFTNKHPSVYAALFTSPDDAVNAHSINDCNVLCLSSMSTPLDDAVKILDAWLSTPFKSPCPTSGNAPWPDNLQEFLDNVISEMKNIPFPYLNCTICCIRKKIDFDPVDIMPGAEMKIVRESPTSAIVRFKARSMEPAHHHSMDMNRCKTSGI